MKQTTETTTSYTPVCFCTFKIKTIKPQSIHKHETVVCLTQKEIKHLNKEIKEEYFEDIIEDVVLNYHVHSLDIIYPLHSIVYFKLTNVHILQIYNVELCNHINKTSDANYIKTKLNY